MIYHHGEFDTAFSGANSTFGQSPDAPLGGAVRQGETIFNTREYVQIL